MKQTFSTTFNVQEDLCSVFSNYKYLTELLMIIFFIFGYMVNTYLKNRNPKPSNLCQDEEKFNFSGFEEDQLKFDLSNKKLTL